MKRIAIVLAAAVVLLGSGQQVPAALVTAGLIYQLDATDAAKIAYDGSGNMISWASSQGSAVGFSMVPGTGAGLTPPTYQATGGGNMNLPNVKFVTGIGPTAQKMLQNAGGTTTPLCVFIMINTDSPGNTVAGIWGWNAHDRGIRGWVDTPPGGAYGNPGDKHMVVNIALRGGAPREEDYGLNYDGDNGRPPLSEDYYWSDTTVIDGHQTWQNKNWGTLGAYGYNSGSRTWDATALGNYYEPPNRSWRGQIGEVLAYDRYLTDAERLEVETYLANKWLVPEPTTIFALFGVAVPMLLKRRAKA
jgi:hypothetical protein